MDRSAAELSAPVARAALRWRALFTVALLSLAALSHSLAGERAAVLSGTRSGAASEHGAAAQQRLARLPVAAQGPISAALGSASPAYRVRAAAGGFQALSRPQALQIGFQRARVTLRTGALRLGLSLRAVGYPGALAALGAVAPTAHANRVRYTHAAISEWLVNGPLGLEQGFTIARAPAAHARGPLTLALAVSGNAHATLSGGGEGVTFAHAGAPALRYGALSATDAGGRALHAWLSLHAGRLLLHVDSAGARYPLRIDPLIHSEQLTGTGEAGEGRFGFSVALSADAGTALVGAPGDNEGAGAAWVFERSGAGWSPGEKLTGSEQGTGGEECGEEVGEEEIDQCGFGRSVALSADGATALIGGPADNNHRGGAWVFTRSPAGAFSQLGAELTGGEAERGGGYFGESVALSAAGDTALIGASGDDEGAGAAWVFRRQGAAFAGPGTELTGAEESGAAHFGRSVALSADGGAALIGGPGDAGYRGAAWAFRSEGAAFEQQGAKLTGSEESEKGRFGFSVALSADAGTALIGARSDTGFAGAAWAFARKGAAFSQLGGKLTGGEESGLASEFGCATALSADGATALIGGRRDNGREGAAWVFTRSGESFTQQGEKLTGAGETVRGTFGASVALSSAGETALIGGPLDNGKLGAAWVGPPLSPAVKKVAPGKGPAAGGTTVTITGTNFAQATAVHFGSTSAISFAVNSGGASITAVSPEETAGTVHVTVTTPIGTSAASLRDRFTFVAPESSSNVGATPATPSATASGGVLGFGPIANPTTGACRVLLLGRSIAVQSHSRAALKLILRGNGTCRGKLTLRVKAKTLKVKAKAKNMRSKTRTIGAGNFSIASGRIRIVRVKLNATGRALLRAGHGRLRASLAILTLSPGPRRAQSASVRLRLQKTRNATTVKK